VNKQRGGFSVLPGWRDRLQDPESVSEIKFDIVIDRIQMENPGIEIAGGDRLYVGATAPRVWFEARDLGVFARP
jgi:hypothetical protein